MKKKKSKKFSWLKPNRAGLKKSAAIGSRLAPILAVSVFFFFCLHGVLKQLHADDFFRVMAVRTHTDGVLTLPEISAVAGVKTGDNLLGIDLQKIAERLEKDRRIRYATVVRVIPNEIMIRVDERHDFLVTPVPGRVSLWVMDEEGYLLRESPKESDVLKFEDRRPNAASYFKQDRYVDDRALRTVFLVKQVVENAPFLNHKKLAKIEYFSEDRIHCVFEGEFELRIGKKYAEEIKKLEIVQSLIASDFTELEYLDLRFQDIVAKKKEKNKKKETRRTP